MSNWIPTNDMRWFKLPPESGVNAHEGFWTYPYVLQQKWKHNEASYYGGRIVSEEWRDVPVVEEE